MSVVRINAITVPAERADELLTRFANRAGEVSKMPGFEAFELLRPSDDRDVFLVYTRWATQTDFDNWLSGQAFQQGHGQTRPRRAGQYRKRALVVRCRAARRGVNPRPNRPAPAPTHSLCPRDRT
jgi:heme oxygenase (mycobilin-producing)